jgi:hypothetical protein
MKNTAVSMNSRERLKKRPLSSEKQSRSSAHNSSRSIHVSPDLALINTTHLNFAFLKSDLGGRTLLTGNFLRRMKSRISILSITIKRDHFAGELNTTAMCRAINRSIGERLSVIGGIFVGKTWDGFGAALRMSSRGSAASEEVAGRF